MDRLMLMAMGGYGDMGMMGGSTAGTGLIDSLKTKLSFLPEWAAILVIAVLVILAAMLVGWIGGKIIGSILYPDPDKQSILSKKQKFMVLGGAIAAIALTIFALTYTPAPDTGDDALPTGENVSMDGMDGMDGMEGTDGEIPEEEPTDSETTDEESTEEETTGETEEESSAAASDSTGNAGTSVSVGGGVMIRYSHCRSHGLILIAARIKPGGLGYRPSVFFDGRKRR